MWNGITTLLRLQYSLATTDQYPLDPSPSSVAALVRLVILFVVIAAVVIVLWLGGIVSVVCSIVLSKGSKPFMSKICFHFEEWNSLIYQFIGHKGWKPNYTTLPTKLVIPTYILISANTYVRNQAKVADFWAGLELELSRVEVCSTYRLTDTCTCSVLPDQRRRSPPCTAPCKPFRK